MTRSPARDASAGGSGRTVIAWPVVNCRACAEHFRHCGARHWRVDPYGYGEHVVPADTASKAKYISFRAAREAGYFGGRDGFWRFLANGVSVSEIFQ